MSGRQRALDRIGSFLGFWWVPVLLLGLSTALFFLGSGSVDGRASSTNYDAGGFRALAELLERDGYKVRVDRSSRPMTKDVALFIVPVPAERDKFTYYESPDGWPSGVAAEIKRRSDANQPTLELALSDRSARKREARQVLNFGIATGLNAQLSPNLRRSGSDILTTEDWIPVLSLGEGLVYRAHDAALYSNELIDQADHAALALKIVHMVSPGKGTIVFGEQLVSGISEDSLWQQLGPWGPALYWQVLLLAIVIAFTVSQRFGPPILDQFQSRGSSALVLAFAELQRRSRKTDLAVSQIARNLDLRLRSSLQLSSAASREERDSRLPEELKSALEALDFVSSPGVSPNRAAAVAGRACRLTDEFVRSRRNGRRG